MPGLENLEQKDVNLFYCCQSSVCTPIPGSYGSVSVPHVCQMPFSPGGSVTPVENLDLPDMKTETKSLFITLKAGT